MIIYERNCLLKGSITTPDGDKDLINKYEKDDYLS